MRIVLASTLLAATLGLVPLPVAAEADWVAATEFRSVTFLATGTDVTHIEIGCWESSHTFNGPSGYVISYFLRYPDGAIERGVAVGYLDPRVSADVQALGLSVDEVLLAGQATTVPGEIFRVWGPVPPGTEIIIGWAEWQRAIECELLNDGVAVEPRMEPRERARYLSISGLLGGVGVRSQAGQVGVGGRAFIDLSGVQLGAIYVGAGHVRVQQPSGAAFIAGPPLDPSLVPISARASGVWRVDATLASFPLSSAPIVWLLDVTSR